MVKLSTIPVVSLTVRVICAAVPLGSLGCATTGIGGLYELYPCPPSIKLMSLIPPIKDLAVAALPSLLVIATLGAKSNLYLDPPFLGINAPIVPSLATLAIAVAPEP